jgi:Ser/Thr protein kinase RdoA (MazF antagonist)
MSVLTSILSELSPIKRVQHYQHLATIVLDSYALEFGAPEFLQHNSGVTYRVPVLGTNQCFLLKIHDSIGDGAAQSATQIDARMVWLAELGQVSPFAIQKPVPNRDGTLVTKVLFPGVAHPVPCTLQQWVPGEHPPGDFTMPQIEAVGAMMAKLHTYSATWQAAHVSSLPTYDADDLCREVAQLRTAVTLDLLSADEYHRLEQTSDLITQMTERLGREPTMWGAIHGDLHHGNLLLEGTTVHPIDFDNLHTTYYLLDLGTTLYHILHQDVAIQAAFVRSYQQIQSLPLAEDGTLELFVTWAAMTNLAFQITIPNQRISPIFARNLRQLVNNFCLKVLSNIPFVCVNATA